MSEDKKSRANWIVDKILLVACGWLIMQTYGNVTESIDNLSVKFDVVVKDINDLDKRTTLLEYRTDQRP